MARIETDPNYSTPATFSRATAAADLFKKEDVQALAAAMSVHDHASTKGLAVARIANGAVTTDAIAMSATAQVGLIAGSTSTPITTSTTFVDMPDMSITLTTYGGDLLCWLTCAFQYNTAGGVPYIAFSLDGAGEAGGMTAQPYAPSAITSATTFWKYSAAAGSHTVKGRWQISMGQLNGYGTIRHLMVLEIKR